MGQTAHAADTAVGLYNISLLRANVAKALDEGLLPEPAGHKLLIAVPEINERTAGGVILTDTHREKEGAATQIGLVVKMGNYAYGDRRDFPTGKWCKPGDFILTRSYVGTRFEVPSLEQEFRLINDASVEAVIDDPNNLVRK